jgi:hypothetical protein
MDIDLPVIACETQLVKVYLGSIHAYHKCSLGNGVRDNVQVYNIPKFDGYHERQQPPVLSENIAEIEAFSRVCVPNKSHIHSNQGLTIMFHRNATLK